jgi:integrase
MLAGEISVGLCLSVALRAPAALRQIRIHDLRHTYATSLLQAGAPITYVSQQMGHRDASITLRLYAHYLPDASCRAVDRLDVLQPSATPAQPEADPAEVMSELSRLL